jgi:hypothetical protein
MRLIAMSVPKQIEHEPEALDLESPPMVWLTPEKARADIDRQAREIAGVSGDEFIRRLDAGEYDGTPDDAEHRDLIHLSMLAALGR